MGERHEEELAIAVAEGIVSRGDAAAVADEACRRQISPLVLLVEKGRLSPDSLRSLLAVRTAEPRSGSPPSISSTDPGPVPPVGRDPSPAFPVRGWGRYTCPRFLGQGGMGTVFAALDPRLRREVAIKFVRGDNPEHAQRLIREARAQARVRHACVCEIHEVGEVEGRVYIAMQYIAGASLAQLSGELTVEQAAMLVRGAADGLHEAHRVGIIHRDVKPSNILVERTEGGELKPYVVDFGLARAAYDDGAMLSDVIVGTPRYMAPEQAAGATANLDRRADVYGLGATLYHLLTGEPPNQGDSPAAVLANLATADPRPPRAIRPDIATDLEAIVLKCLDKDRTSRYDSARALADDLGRFLDGAPVIARPVGTWSRLRRRLARHRRLAGAGAAAMLVLVATIAWAIETRAEASSRERLARRFTEMVERVEAMARYSALSPLHDVRPDRAAMRARMAELEGEIRRAGSIALGPGHFALGRGYLALDDDDHARAELDAAWQAGYREPRVAYALALALGHLYQQALRATERIEDKERRAEQQREIARQLREPALAYLEASRGTDVPSPSFVAALMAYYRGSPDEALRQLDAVKDSWPWFYEPAKLRGDILLARASSLRHRGEFDDARKAFDAARAAYAMAAGIGESVPSLYEARGELEFEEMAMELYGKGAVMPCFERAVAATDSALRVLPDGYSALVLGARARRVLAEHEANRGSNTEDLLARAVADTRRAIEVSPVRVEARLELARALRQWGQARTNQGQDPSEQLRAAAETSAAVAPGDRDAAYHGNLGQIYMIWATYQDQRGQDARANRSKAIDAYSRALQIDGAQHDVWTNLATTYFQRASRPDAQDPDGDLTRAMGALVKARAINPRHLVTAFSQGQIYELMAARASARGGDPRPDLARALAALEGGIALNPAIPELHNAHGNVWMDQARDAWSRGAPPESLLEEAQRSFEHAIAVAPGQGYGYNNLGEVFLQRAVFQRALGQDVRANLHAAVRWVQQAIDRSPDQPAFWANVGMAYAIEGAYLLTHEQDPEARLALAAAAIRKALALDPKDPQARLALAETQGLHARLLARQGRARTDELQQVARVYQAAIDVAPEPALPQIALGQFCRAWAADPPRTGGTVDLAIERGLEIVNAVLGTHVRLPDALVLRARLQLLRARRAGDETARREHVVRASEDFTAAQAIHPALANAWTDEVALAAKLAGRAH
jgi:serine/threonine-protein kinase